MMTIYDMNTGQILESGQADNACSDSYVPEQERQTELHLQSVIPSGQVSKEAGMAPALAGVDIDALLLKMD
jgi:hypothetical protein